MNAILIILVAALFQVAVSTPDGGYMTGLAWHPIARNYREVGIAGGHNITIENATYVGSILDTDSNLIGTAVILNTRWIITAAYNFDNLTEADVQIRVGSTYSEEQGKLVKVQTIFRPENYSGYWDYDLALAKLEKPLWFSKTIGSVKIATYKLPKNNTIGVVSGFGWTDNSTGGYLQQVSLPILNYTQCKPMMPDFFTPLSFCTAKKGAGPCDYDIGSPLVHNRRLIGIFIGNNILSTGDSVSAYAAIYRYKHWIKYTIWDNTEPSELIEHDQNMSDEDDDE